MFFSCFAERKEPEPNILTFLLFFLKTPYIKVFILFYRKLKVNKNNIKQNIPSPYMSPNNFNIIFAKK